MKPIGVRQEWEESRVEEKRRAARDIAQGVEDAELEQYEDGECGNPECWCMRHLRDQAGDQ